MAFADEFNAEIMKLLEGITPEGGFGIPNVQSEVGRLGRGFERAGVRAGEQDIRGLERRGLGQSVLSATTRGRRAQQSQNQLSDAIIQLLTRSGTLAGQQRQGALRTLAPIAEREVNRPSALAQLFGGALNLAGRFGPGLLIKDPLTALLEQSLGQGGRQEFV